ncbi:MAG: glycosyltransferase [Acidipila sp.]|nr:glycosyltransferase [Acidipila sp.]
MHFLFVHVAPGQFEHIAKYLVREGGHRCTFVCEARPGTGGGVTSLRYRVYGTTSRKSHYYAKPFEEAVRHAAGVYKATKPLRNGLRPDLIIGYSGYGSTLFLPELFPGTPIINYFEFFLHPHHSVLDFRPEWVPFERNLLRARARNAMILLDLENCTAGYTPTEFQRTQFPQAYGPKIRVIPDGVDTDFWRRQIVPGRRLGRLRFEQDTRIVTYATRGFESARGFDIFLKVAKRIYEAEPNVVFLVAGDEGVYYGHDLQYIREKSFFRHAWNQEKYDLRRFRFLGQVSRKTLARIFSLSDLHIYLTIPCPVSWSLLEALASECTVLGSDTEPTREIIRDNQNGLLSDFFDIDGLARRALQVLKDPAAYRKLGRAARTGIQEKHSLPVTMPRTASFFEEVAHATEER